MSQKWEYKSCETFNYSLDSILKKWAAAGWELVSTNTDSNTVKFYLFWRRPVS
jgi:hypothetical protein